ncbi:phycobilisome linker polypeptide [Aphanothece sacrum]|uniref:CpcD phycobilisome linker protein n=1 Tax=Aphanothece sacrum FPU1 TaxID=1920663 RepID=A0A401ILD2_APHSA|nr:phycobilisome linker polypeptide [Aphanothece sacrum]GBF82046.1 CpcD phycobilisome linker protein [Aphanothece sacrum FPU1]GBF82050.1 CpcD phycobilisome linker protein [Aphanothece sacrum FPU1]GBF85863.1 CpcD phycobilisome linker domain protein [Aphanothece sacrum FPU3]
MSRQSLVGSSSTSASRVFVYEVTGLRQNEESDKNNYPFRQSGSVFVNVPYSRMNEQMQRITRLGGRIVGIKPLVDA